MIFFSQISKLIARESRAMFLLLIFSMSHNHFDIGGCRYTDFINYNLSFGHNSSFVRPHFFDRFIGHLCTLWVDQLQSQKLKKKKLLQRRNESLVEQQMKMKAN